MSRGERKMGKIHPVIIYPYTDPYVAKDRDSVYRFDRRNLEYLYSELTALIRKSPYKYERPITVVNHQTIDRSDPASDLQGFLEYIERNYSRIIKAWCVDTCQMWQTGLGDAFNKSKDRGDVYWLIPGDYKYSEYSQNQNNQGKHIFKEMERIPNLVLRQECCLCIGEIQVGTNNSKQLIDTYGTYGLLDLWFPTESRQIQMLTAKPRTEFFAVDRDFLREVLNQRWYPFEQTLVMLLWYYKPKRKAKKVSLGEISDSAQGRDSLCGAMQQLERIEMVLKRFWIELRQDDPESNWIEEFRKLDEKSEEIKIAASLEIEPALGRTAQ
jgi:hypothetical protein